MKLPTIFAALVATAMTASGCGAGPAGSDELTFGLTRCDGTSGTRIAADPSWYRDEPIYVGNEMPVEAVQEWARGQDGFAEVWVDRDHNGWVTVGYTGDQNYVDERQAALESEFPDAGVVAVLVPYTDTELEALQNEVSTALSGSNSWSSGRSVSRARVEVGVPVLDETHLEQLASFADRPLCVDGADPADAVADGPQPTEGDGWRLLGHDETGPAYRTGVATTDEQLADLWATSGLAGDPPAVDFESEIAVWFGAVYGSGCPIRLDDVVVDTDSTDDAGTALVHGRFVLPGNPVACNDDANGHAYVVAVERSLLPTGPFAVQLNAEDPPGGAPEERTEVMVDLSVPGSVASSDDLVVRTLDEVEPTVPVFEPGEVIEPGFPRTFRLDLACGVDVIGPLNSVTWTATGDGPNPPAAWQAAADDGDVFPEAEFLLTEDPARLTITVAGEARTYEPLPSSAAADLDPTC